MCQQSACTRNHALPFRQDVNLDDPAVAPSGRTSFNLVLGEGTLQPGEQYSFRLDVTTTSPNGKGQSEATFTVNSVSTRRKKSRGCGRPTS